MHYNKLKRGGLLTGVLLTALVLSACGDEIYYEPGVYKGGEDPTGSQEAVEERSSQIRDRSDRAYSDRGL